MVTKESEKMRIEQEMEIDREIYKSRKKEQEERELMEFWVDMVKAGIASGKGSAVCIDLANKLLKHHREKFYG